MYCFNYVSKIFLIVCILFNFYCSNVKDDLAGLINIGNNNDSTVTDIEGNIYHIVKIGNQFWTAENLRTTKYNDGTPIQYDTSTTTWASTSPKYCYNNNITNKDSINKYGALYNWFVISRNNPKRIAPPGWHVPSDSEWTVLEKYLMLNGYKWDGTTDTSANNKIAKSLAAKTDWKGSTISGAIGNDLTKNNKSGFGALPGGYRTYLGAFFPVGSAGEWWSTSEGFSGYGKCRSLLTHGADLNGGSNYKTDGFSIRLVRD